MIIFLYGPDSYRRKQKLDEILDEYKKKHSHFAVEICDLSEEGEFESFRNKSQTPSLFDPLPLTIIKNFFDPPKDKAKEYKDFFEPIVQDKNRFFIIAANEAPKAPLDFLTKEPCRAQEFGILEGAAFESFIKTEAVKASARLTPSLLKYLSENFAGDSWRVVTEIQKIAVSGAPNAQSGGGEVQRIDVFSALFNLKKQPMRSALPILERLIAREDGAKLFNMLAFGADVKSKEIFADYDVLIKSGRLEYEGALTDYVLRNVA